MKNFLILIAGYPGTGKSYLCKMILKEYPDFVTFSPDEVKEQLWDKYGFKNLDEKNKLINLSWEYYYSFIDLEAVDVLSGRKSQKNLELLTMIKISLVIILLVIIKKIIY